MVNKVQMIVLTVCLHLTQYAEPSLALQGPIIYELLLGDSVSLICCIDVDSNPETIIIWIRPDGSRIIAYDNAIQLNITRTVLSDAGVWRCELFAFRLGIISTFTFQLIIIVGQPSSPIIESSGATWVFISWTAPLMADSSILHYEIIARVVDRGERRVLETDTNITSFNVTGLLPGTTYELTVVAVYQEGDINAKSVESDSVVFEVIRQVTEFVPRSMNTELIGSTELVSRSVNTELIGSVVGTVLAILIATIILLSIFCLYCRYHRTAKMSSKKTESIHNGPWEGGDDNHLYPQAESGEDRKEMFVKSSFELSLPPHLIIPSSSIKLIEIIGQGEFGIVYKGYVKNSDSHSIEEYLAIKTLKGFYDHGMVNDMLKECSRMLSFDYVHVLTLKGVCLDGGPAPYIIMPFMANGSLLAYLKKNRKSLVISSEDADDKDAEMVRKRLMDMCIQVAKGMEYLASMKVVHRDLAARNCMIDFNFVIKVADFGLSESIGVKEYFRQDDTSAVKLPLKWLPPESINDHIFSEKSDVWAYGVTCWEIFSGGKVPYAELMVREIPKLLAEGYRLEKPLNDACSEEVYSFMHQCWSGEPEHRPSFTQLVESLSNSLEESAGYLHIGAFGENGPEVPQ